MKTPPHQPPQAFVGTPGGFQPSATPARTVVVAPLKRTHQADALLHVRLPNRIELNREALRQSNLAPGLFADIIPPRRGVSAEWFLDTRPLTTCRLEDRGGGVCFCTRTALPAIYFRVFGKAPRSRLSFRIGEELTEEVCLRAPDGKPICAVRGIGVFRLYPL